jgi:hypothetical protein
MFAAIPVCGTSTLVGWSAGVETWLRLAAPSPLSDGAYGDALPMNAS